MHLSPRGMPECNQASARSPTGGRLGRRGLLVSVLAVVGGFVTGWLMPGRPPVDPLPDAGDSRQLCPQWSKRDGSPVSWLALNRGSQPGPPRIYTGAQLLALPDPHGDGGLSLEEAVEARRSRRAYSGLPLNLEQLSRLLYAAQGITDARSGYRAAPSAGALYPVETYCVVHSVTEVESGLYHYAVASHALELLQSGDFRAHITSAGLGQAHLGQASVCFVLSAVFERTRRKYRERAERYVLLEIGHIGQNLCLAASSMGLGACPAGAFLDDDLNTMLGLDGQNEAALYIVAVGRL